MKPIRIGRVEVVIGIVAAAVVTVPVVVIGLVPLVWTTPEAGVAIGALETLPMGIGVGVGAGMPPGAAGVTVVVIGAE